MQLIYWKKSRMKCFKILLAGCFIFSLAICAFPQEDKEAPLKVAIFGRNRSGDNKHDKHIEQLKNQLTASLSGKFTVIDKDDAINTFEKAKKKEKDVKDMDIYSFLLASQQLHKEESNIDNEKTIEQKASALRISQLLGADYFLIADLEEITDNNIRDEVYGSKINDLVLTVDVSVKILDGRRGGSIAGKSVRKSKRLHGDEKSNYTDGDITQNLPTLMKQAGKEIAKYFLDNTQKISDFKVDIAKSVKFIVKSNVDNATVELDGVAIGSAPGDFKVPPGLHRVRVTKDGHKSLERDINIYNNFQLKVSLEMTDEGLKKYRGREEIGMEKKKADTETYSIKKKADAEYKWGPEKKKGENW